MTLRLRLALTILLTAIPLVLGFAWLRDELDRSSFEDGLQQFVNFRLNSTFRGNNTGRSLCELDPETWGGGSGFSGFSRRRFRRGGGRDRPRPPGRGRPLSQRRTSMWAYNKVFNASNPQAPPFPERLKKKLSSGAERASVMLDREDSSEGGSNRKLLALGMFMDWTEGPCSIILALAPYPPRGKEADNLWWMTLGLCSALLLAVLLAAGPMVRRIRLLTSDVRAAALAHYKVPVEERGGDEIGRLAKAFNEAGAVVRVHMNSLEEREKTLRDFISNTTHDVMIPLTVLQGHIARLHKASEQKKPTEPALLVAALNETQYIASILQNLSTVAKLEGATPQLQKNPVDLSGVVERAVARHVPLAEAGKITLEHGLPESPLETLGDVTLIEQALSNVIHNAVRYNQAGGHIAVLLEEQGDEFSLLVIDDGPGISKEELAKLPERRFRGKTARSRNPDGTGLGLHIARDVAAKHGFRFEIKASEYGGLQVSFAGKILRERVV